MEIATTYEERIALIKKIAERRARWKKGADIAKKWANANKKNRKGNKVNLTDKYDNGESEIHYADSSKYIDKHYGDRIRGRKNYEEDWG